MRYYIIAGEASGDLHGSNLMKGIYQRDSRACVRFWGGDLMKAVHDEAEGSRHEDSGLVVHYKDGAIMGFFELIGKARRLLGNVGYCKKDILEHRPDVVILIDYPGFNFKIAKFAHKRALKVFYYIAPKVWASRERRIEKIRKYVDKLFIVFPFEVPYFTSKGIDFIYKGNPLVDAVDNSLAMNETREEFLRRNALDDKPIIAMLAGSRKGEISSMMGVMTEFAARMRALPQYADYQFLIAGAPARSMGDYSPWLNEGNSYIKVLFGQTQSIIRQAEAAVINSGTASLEAVLLNTPQVVGYIVNPLSYVLTKLIIKVKYISLGNLCIDRLAFRELIQQDFTAENILEEVRRLLEDEEYRRKMLADYAQIRNLLGGSGTSAAVAQAMLEELKLIPPR